MSDYDCKEIQAKIVLLDERQKHIREVMDLRFSENNTSTKLASAEISRRLELLNGEASRLSSMQATYLPREVYEQNQKAMADNVAQNRRATLIAIISAIGSVVLFAANLIWKSK